MLQSQIFESVDDLLDHYRRLHCRVEGRARLAVARLERQAQSAAAEVGRSAVNEQRRELTQDVERAATEFSSHVLERSERPENRIPSTKWELSRVIISEVADAHGVSVDDLMGEGRARRLTDARCAAMCAVADQFRRFPQHHRWYASTTWIGKLFRRDHTTVIYTLAKGQALRAK
jgi:chromosomal replication initiation ATPase DnaA